MKVIYNTCLAVMLGTVLNAQAPDLKFEKIDVEQGLSQSTVNCIIQDKTGFLWIGTIDGLNKYDGYQFNIFRADADDPDAISSNYINCMLEDRNGLIWVGTREGLNCYNPVYEIFTKFIHDEKNDSSIPDNNANCLLEDKDGFLWVGTNCGLAKFDRKSNTSKNYLNDTCNQQSIPSNYIYSIYQDRSDVIWIGTSNGLAKYNPDKDDFTTYTSKSSSTLPVTFNAIRGINEDNKGNLWVGTTWGLNKINPERTEVSHYLGDPQNPSNPRNLSSSGIYCIFNDNEGNVWIGVWNGGLLLYNEKDDTFYRYLANPNDPFSISYNTISCITEDKAGIIWVATWGGGINKYDKSRRKFRCYQNRSSDPKGLSSNYITSIFKDKNDIIWLGTWGGGINRFDRKNNTFDVYKSHPTKLYTQSDDTYAILEDKNGTLWFGTRGGLECFDPVTREFHNYGGPSGKTKLFNNRIIRTMLESPDSMIWIGTDDGLHEFDPKTGNYVLYLSEKDDTTTLSSSQIRKIYLAHNGYIWIGTTDGLNKLDLRTRKFTRYKSDGKTSNTLSHNYIWSLCEDKDGILWIGTNGGGLNRLDPETGVFRVYNKDNGLPNEGVYGILADNNNYIWLSTNRGISRFDPKDGTFKNYETDDGLQGYAFNGGSCFQSEEGEMFFGGYNGFNSFFPDSVKDNNYVPPVIITDFQIFNKKVLIGKNSPLNESINLAREVNLSWRDYIFSVEFAALHFSSPQDNIYMYKLEGVDKEWVTTNSKRRFVSYTNLNPGKYLLRIKGTNSDGLWNPKETNLTVIISPPYWKKWWFKVLMLIFIVSGITGVFRWRLSFLKNDQRILEQKVSEKTKELIMKKEELEKTLSDLQNTQKHLIHSEKMASLGVLSAGVGHEINNPLNFIKGGTHILNNIIASSEDHIITKIEPCVEIINEGVSRISKIVNSLSHYTRSGDQMNEKCEIHEILDHSLVILHNQLKKKAEVIKEYTDQSVSVSGNEGKLHQVFLNILSNAGQAIPEKGKIIIKTEVTGDQIKVIITDTGCGIRPEHLQKIFDPFFTTKAPGEGTGLGLSISYKIIEEHDGFVEINSIVNEGTEVIIILPKRK
jgi:ligand-binding sensor domain-containing protein/signal transduction histidine kinase